MITVFDTRPNIEAMKMRGHEHYREAERILGDLQGRYEQDAEDSPVRRQEQLATAQVHATLANAAAVGLLAVQSGHPDTYSTAKNGWDEVI